MPQTDQTPGGQRPGEQERPEKPDAGKTEELPGRPGSPPKPPAAKKGGKTTVANEVMEWVKAFAIALVAALILTQVIIVNAQVPSESMEDTIRSGDRVIGFRLAYLFNPPERGDIIIFKFPDDESKLYIKRVIGMPGDLVEVRDGRVYLNGADTPLEDSYVKGEPVGDFGPFNVPQDSYFVMGDNRNHSWDSRFWQNTYVHEDKIVGKGLWRVWPNPTVLA